MENQNSLKAGKGHRAVPSSELRPTSELGAAHEAFRKSVGFQINFILYSGLEPATAIDHICSAADRLIAAEAQRQAFDDGHLGGVLTGHAEGYELGYRDGILKAVSVIPTNWLDPLLTGARSVIGQPPYGCPEIEQLLRAVKGTIAALATKPVTCD